jgi:hypothetical protein
VFTPFRDNQILVQSLLKVTSALIAFFAIPPALRVFHSVAIAASVGFLMQVAGRNARSTRDTNFTAGKLAALEERSE